jgi:hypothetical protein
MFVLSIFTQLNNHLCIVVIIIIIYECLWLPIENDQCDTILNKGVEEALIMSLYTWYL